jgi:hypothetical protein
MTNLLAERWHSTSCFEYTFPWKVAALIDPDVDKSRACLQTFLEWLAAIRRLDVEALCCTDAAAFKMNLIWVLWDWPREVIFDLEEYEFLTAPTPMF